MTWSDFSYSEKVSILHSVACVAMADEHINFSENQHIVMTAMKMVGVNSYTSLISDSQRESIDSMIGTLRNMSVEKKNELGYVWMDCARRSNGGTAFGILSLSDFPDEQETILLLSKKCNVSVKESYTFYD